MLAGGVLVASIASQDFMRRTRRRLPRYLPVGLVW